jgi:tRNA (mo5U34)-methyltransferase
MQPARLMTSPQPGDDVPEAVVEFAPWFHNIHLPGGVQTAPNHPLGDFPAFKWRQVAACLPADLTGWRALDVGCNAGFYTIELARRGAKVTGLDLEDHFLRQARWAVRECGVEDRVTLVQGQVYDIASWPDPFDLVLFMGVFYHLRYPALALDLLASRVRRRFIFQTLTMPGDESVAVPPDLALEQRERMLEPGWPRMAFIEHRLAGDPTNWWAPNHACITALLRTAGLQVTAQPGHEIYVCTPADPSTRPGLNDELRAIFPGAPGR